MRQKADKLEKGKWYADSNLSKNTTFLKFSHRFMGRFYFTSQSGNFLYYLDDDGCLSINANLFLNLGAYLPTPEDIEKYNLNETE